MGVWAQLVSNGGASPGETRADQSQDGSFPHSLTGSQNISQREECLEIRVQTTFIDSCKASALKSGLGKDSLCLDHNHETIRSTRTPQREQSATQAKARDSEIS